MDEPLNILVMEDRNADFMMVERHLKQNGLSVRCSRVDSPEGLREAIDRKSWDLVLTDYNVPQLNFQDSLKLLLAELPDVPVIMVSGTMGEEKAVDILKLGVLDFVLKDNLARLVPAVLRSLKEKKELEERRRTEERLKLALRGANDGLWDWNLITNELYLSPRWKSMLGYADEELENSYNSWIRLLHPEDSDSALTQMRDFLEGRTANFEIEFRMLHKEGHSADILSRGFLLFDDQGNALRMVGTHVDVTERKKLEEQYRQAQKMEAVGQLAGGVAHDFNNILTAIIGNTHFAMLKMQENDPARKYLEQVLAASDRAAVMNQSLLAFSRKQMVSLAVIDLCAVIKEFEAFLRRLIREDIELRITCSEAPLNVLADRGQIEQVLMNLVTNARDAMPQGGKLFMEIQPVTLDQQFVEAHRYGKAGAYVLFSVSDSGVGMDKETQSRIFEPFFTTKEQGKGTGLGLSMAYGIIKKHDGFINAYSEPGTGTIFKIYLPRIQGPAQAGITAPREVATVLLDGAETILVGEDDEALRRLATKVFNHYGYRVIVAVDGQDAVDKFIEYGDSIQLVILDAIMPKKNGREAFQEMRTMRPDLKAVFVSGYARDIFAENDMPDGNSIFVQKPVSPNELVAKVREMLDK
ncbi:MAG: response regulator [Steroidobacteraceae bacterium]|nr:response regulator [Deltaproteobacteria bacterium]